MNGKSEKSAHQEDSAAQKFWKNRIFIGVQEQGSLIHTNSETKTEIQSIKFNISSFFQSESSTFYEELFFFFCKFTNKP